MIAAGEKIAGRRGRFRWLLRYQIIFPFTAVILLAIVSISALGAWLAARSSGEQTKARLRHVTAALAEAAYPLTPPVLEQVKQFSGADFVLSAPDGKALVATLTAAESRAFTQILTAGERIESGATVEIGTDRFFHDAAVTRTATGQQARVLHVLYPVRAWNEAKWRAATPPLYVGGFAVVTAVVLSLVIARRITRPLDQLRAEIDRLVDGAFRPVPLPSHNDELRDLITSVNVLAKRLSDYRQAIQSSERLVVLGQLSAGLAHQVRNAVAGARIALQLHQRKCDGVDPESLEVAMRQLRLSEEHLNCVLSAGQPQALRLAEVNVEELVADVVSLVQPTCRHRRVELRSDCHLEKPLVEMDANQVRQALLNLVLNAVEAAGPSGWVRIEVAAKPPGVAITVSDSGPGPPPELAATMFDPLATGKPCGIGLGLAVASQVAQAHAGSLRFSREQTTRFELLLPRIESESGMGSENEQQRERGENGEHEKISEPDQIGHRGQNADRVVYK